MTDVLNDTTTASTPPEAGPPAPVMAAVEHVSSELAAAASAGLALLGDRLGLYRAMAGAGPLTPSEVAARAGCAERYVREWLANQAAGGWVRHDPGTDRFALDDAYAAVLAHDASPVFLGGSLQLTAAVFAGLDRLERAFRTGDGIAWGEQHRDLHDGVARFFAVACAPYLADWLAAIDGATEALEAGGRALDVGCGQGAAAIALAEAFSRAEVDGVDSHEASIGVARERAAAAGLAHRVHFTATEARDLEPGRYDVALALDCLHDLGDPVAAAAAIRTALRPTGALLLVEPAAGDRLEDNLHPVGRMFYAGSTAFCTPCALAQDGGWALGNQAGPARLRDVLGQAGFSAVREVARTPWQLVLEARP